MGIEAYRWGPTNQSSYVVGWSELQPLVMLHNSIGEISSESEFGHWNLEMSASDEGQTIHASRTKILAARKQVKRQS